MARPTRSKENSLKAHAASADSRLNDLIIGTEVTVGALDAIVTDLDDIGGTVYR